MHKQLLLASLLGWLATSTAFAGTYEWTSSYTQGVEEHLVDDGNGNQLDIACPDDDESSVSAYATIAGALHLSEPALKTAAHRFRRRYRDALRARIAATVDTPDQIDDEIQHLFNSL